MDTNDQFDSLEDALKTFRIIEEKPQILFKKYFNNNRKSREQLNFLEEIIRSLRSQNSKLVQRVTLLKEKQQSGDDEIEKINSKLVYMTKLNNDLAAALGSCYLCWGEEPECSNCSGQGVPGWNVINKRLFYKYVIPALEKFEKLDK